jgi:hypothetical protein
MKRVITFLFCGICMIGFLNGMEEEHTGMDGGFEEHPGYGDGDYARRLLELKVERIMKPEEIRTMPEEVQISFVQGECQEALRDYLFSGWDAGLMEARFRLLSEKARVSFLGRGGLSSAIYRVPWALGAFLNFIPEDQRVRLILKEDKVRLPPHGTIMNVLKALESVLFCKEGGRSGATYLDEKNLVERNRITMGVFRFILEGRGKERLSAFEGPTLIHDAAEYGRRMEVSRDLLSALPDGKRREVLEQGNRFGETPLHLAALGKDEGRAIEVCRLLLEQGASKAKRDSWSRLPCDRAGHESVRKLLENPSLFRRFVTGLKAVWEGAGDDVLPFAEEATR